MTPAKTNVMRIVCPKCKATTHKEQDDNEENKKYDMHSQDDADDCTQNRTTVRSKRAKTNTEQTQNNSDNMKLTLKAHINNMIQKMQTLKDI